MQEIVDNNTKHFKTDYIYDKEMFVEAAYSPQAHETKFLWLSRQNGTHCLAERAFYCKDTYEYNTWLSHCDSKSESVLYFAVEITGIEDGIVKGDIYEIDPVEHSKKAKKAALPPYGVFLVYDKSILHLEYSERWKVNFSGEGLKFYEILPADLMLWNKTLKEAQAERHNEQYEEWDLQKLKEHYANITSVNNQKASDFIDKADHKSLYGIYQVKAECENEYLFRNYQSLENDGKKVSLDNYELVYVDKYNDEELEEIYAKFNISHPQDFKGHSLSVSDLIVIKEGGQYHKFFVDSMGFKLIDSPFAPNTKKSKSKDMVM